MVLPGQNLNLMRAIFGLSLFLILSLPLQAQEAQAQKTYRSDTLDFSVQLRYLFVSYGAGVEFPFRQHSFGLQLGYNAVPVDGNIYLDFNLDKVAALEYKRYIPRKSGSENQSYYGSYLLFKNTEHASPHEADWEGNWYRSSSLNIGIMGGYKWYKGRRTYLELFAGIHAGWRRGRLRWDNSNPDTGQRNPTYRPAEEPAYGIRIGLSFGFHPLKPQTKEEH